MGKNLNDKHFLNIKMNSDHFTYKKQGGETAPLPSINTYTCTFILKCRRLRKLLNLLKYVHNYVLSWKLLSHKTYDFKQGMLKYFLFAWNTWMCCHVDRFVLIKFWHDIHFNEIIFVHEHVSEDECVICGFKVLKVEVILSLDMRFFWMELDSSCF